VIWFTCKKCGKTHNRADTSAGTLVFCECGNGNTVPWESTATPPAVPPMAAPAPQVPELGPIQFDPVTIPTPASSASGAKSSSYPPSTTTRRDDDDYDRPYRRGRTEKRDPDFCFNHQRRPKVEVCSECEQSFCADCLVKFRGVLMCGPCKNFESRRAELPPVATSVASASLIITLIAGPLMTCMLLWQPASTPIRMMSLLSLLPQFLALGLGVWALRDAEKDKKGGGQWVAVTGVATASLTCLLIVLLNLAAWRLA
jgi:hypothetical protein